MCDNHTSKECKDLWHHNDATNLFNHPRVIRAAFRAKKEAELGKHAAQSGMDLKAYAEASGKGYQGLYYKQRGYAVYHVVNEDHEDPSLAMEYAAMDGDMELFNAIDSEYQKRCNEMLAKLRDNWRNLAEIHAAPNWLWKALVAEMLDTPRARGRGGGCSLNMMLAHPSSPRPWARV